MALDAHAAPDVHLPDVHIPDITIPLEDIAPWAVLAALIAALFVYFVSTEQGAYAVFDGMYVHEFVHDGRHLLGFPCH
jgi:hypothetical protein